MRYHSSSDNRHLAPVWIVGIASYVPERVLTNEDIEEGMPWLETSARWIKEHVGIMQRHIAGEGEKASDMAAAAARSAMADARVGSGQIDLVIHATNTPDDAFPAGAARIQESFGRDPQTRRLRMSQAGCFDIQQGCASFLGGIRLAAGMIAAGEVTTVLVTGADVGTRMVDWTDRNTCILLGDAACAAVLTSREPSEGVHRTALRYLAGHMQTDCTVANAIRRDTNLPRKNDPFRFMGAARSNGTTVRERIYGRNGEKVFGTDYTPFFRMEGRDVYRFVKRSVMQNGYLEVLKKAGLLGGAKQSRQFEEVDHLEQIPERSRRREILAACAEGVDLFIPHNANLYLNLELAESMQIPLERVYINIYKYGNTSAASVGLALEEALRIPAEYSTLPRRDREGNITVAASDVLVHPLSTGQNGLLLSFGAGNSWNYVMVRREI